MHIDVVVTPQGQITLSEAVVARLGLKPGEVVRLDLRVDDKPTADAVAPKTKAPTAAGMLYKPGRRPLTQAEIDDAIAAAVAEKTARR